MASNIVQRTGTTTPAIGPSRPSGEGASGVQSGRLGPRSGVAVEPRVSLPKSDGGSVGIQARSRSGVDGGKPVSPSASGVVRQPSASSASSVSSSSSSSVAAPLSFTSDVRSRVLTANELVEKMGKTPARDGRQFLFFGKVTSQSRYKQTLNELKAYNTQVGSLKLSDDPATRQGQIAGLKTRLDDVATKAGAYVAAKHSAAHKGAMNELVAQIANEKALLDKVMTDPKATAASGLTWGEAVEFARHGVPLGQHAKTGQLDDAHLAGKPKRLGAGAFNAVFKATYATDAGTATRVVKPLPAEEPGRRAAVATATGIPAESPRYGNRNIATGFVNAQLGLKVVPESGFAMRDGRLALAMELAPGITAKEALAVRPSLVENPALQKQVNDLEWLDAIMGQGDRHHSNYMINVAKDGSVTVTGIDNDQCAGKKLKDPDEVILRGPGSKKPADQPIGHNIGLPPLISKELAQKLAAMDFDRDLRPGMVELLDKDELDAMKDRFDAAKAKAQALDAGGYAVEDWGAWTAPASAGASAGKGVAEFLLEAPKRETSAGQVPPSYLARDFLNAGPLVIW